jgi:enoyl-CoA hydratase
VSYQNILFETDQGIARISVNRPEKLNALNNQTVIELSEAFRQAADDTSIRVVILTGAGDKAFVAGADIGEIQTLSPTKALEFSRAGQSLMLQIENLGKPVIAAINGYALGGGCELAMACTLRIAADSALLGLPEITLGIMPGFGGTQRMLRLAGRTATLELALTGTPVDAARAQSLGIVTRVVPAAELGAATDKMAAKLARSAPLAMRSIIESVNLAAEASLERGLEQESLLFALCCSSEDMKEGTTAFLEKRKAEFKGS